MSKQASPPFAQAAQGLSAKLFAISAAAIGKDHASARTIVRHRRLRIGAVGSVLPV